ncbi:MAG TPA: tRNA (guanosine(46)-N7)-methyltransferase TrmB [Casimicrobiaceae bacterium]|nr:tRNA (guanosine(46)-N7)-methyltransferase TrmB [Casimicrobiaceae bacterium]
MNAPQAPPLKRPIRSYVLRQGRFSAAQRRAFEALLPRFGIAFTAVPLDLATVFGRDHPKILEIGFGMGEATAAIAEAQPDRDFVAVEVHSPGVGSLLKLIGERQLANIRIVQHDAAEVVAHMIGPGTLAGIHVFFPDPWPKKRHHKRRLLQPAFVRALAERLAPGGYLHVATDWEDYAQDIVAAGQREPLLAGTGGFVPRPAHRPPTKFERRGVELGHGVRDIVFNRR